MTAAERYRQLEISPSVQVARWIFNNRLNNAPTIPLREVVEDIKTGKTPSKNDKKYYDDGVLDWFKPSDIGEGKYLTSAKDKLSQLAMDTKQATIYQPGTLLITAIGDIGRLAITKDVASSNQQITGIAFNKLVLTEYAYYYFLAFRAFFYTDVSQTTLPIVNQKKITSIPFILCSIKEQKTTIDFLSAIELITLPQDVEHLDSLTSDSELLEIAKGIFAIHFASATLVAEFDKQENHLTQLRQALLREAMQGQLLPQDPTDEPAALLLKKLQAAKAATGKGGQGKAGALFAEGVEVVEGPFQIPANWVWCKLNDISRITGGGTPSMGNPDYWNGDILWVTPKDMYADVIVSSEMKITHLAVQNSSANLVPQGSLLVVGRSGILKRKIPVSIASQELTVNQDMKVIVPADKSMSRYLQLMLRGLGKSILTDYVKYGMTVHSLKYQEFAEMPIPLPPLSEQHRIVAKLEQLLQHCDALEQRIRESRKLAEELLQTALREALAPPAGTEPAEEAELELAEAAAAPAPAGRGRPRQPKFSLDNPPPDLFDFL